MIIDLHLGGISHKTSSIFLRERLAIAPEKQAEFLQSFLNATGAMEAALLMTCNRCEWYWSGAEEATVSAWLRDYFNVANDEWDNAYYSYTQAQAIEHLMRVAAGLDSMVMGEPQILGQMKAAINQANVIGSVGNALQQVFAAVFSTAKKVRTQTAIGSKPASVAYAAVSLAKCIFNDFATLTVLLVGAGNTTEDVMKHFQKLGVTQFIVTNRTLSHAQQLAQKCNGIAMSFEQLTSYALPKADVVVTATASTEIIISKHAVQQAMRTRRRPMHLIDLAVPRDIEPAIANLDGVYLYDMDVLQKIVQQNKEDRAAYTDAAQQIIEHELRLFVKRQHMRTADPVIRAYRQKMETIRDAELQKAQRLLEKGTSAEEVLARFAHNLTKKLMHEPTTLLRELNIP